ncbi:MAG: CAP domain-containing protein [Bacteroidia bacterium]|nr:CAP domain-containing protein [Bacteroidia bacterium]
MQTHTQEEQPVWAHASGVANFSPQEDHTTEEQRVIELCNIARTEPKRFAKEYAGPWIDSAGKKTSYTNSLMRTLQSMKAVEALQFNEKLKETAAGHARKSGNAGTTGHSGKKQRFKQSGFSYWGENCSYGYNNALDIVMQLLIDQNIKSLGHRKNILDPKFTHIGVSIHKHKKYTWNCVQNFGGK